MGLDFLAQIMGCFFEINFMMVSQIKLKKKCVLKKIQIENKTRNKNKCDKLRFLFNRI